jgi:hypothetical protein
MWLDILLNCGFCLVLVYLSGIIKGLRKKGTSLNRFNIIVIFLLMFVSGIGGGINSGYIFWFLVLKEQFSPVENNKKVMLIRS